MKLKGLLSFIILTLGTLFAEGAVVLARGKWMHSMVMNPRDLNVFNPPTVPVGLTEEEVARYARCVMRGASDVGEGFVAKDAIDYASATFTPKEVAMLGHSQKAIPIPKGESISYEMELEHEGPALLTTALIPTQPNDTGDIRVAICVDGGEPVTVSYKEQGRTDTWKENVLRNQVRIKMPLDLKSGNHTVTVKALDAHVILDQLMLDSKPARKYYVIPTRL